MTAAVSARSGARHECCKLMSPALTVRRSLAWQATSSKQHQADAALCCAALRNENRAPPTRFVPSQRQSPHSPALLRRCDTTQLQQQQHLSCTIYCSSSACCLGGRQASLQETPCRKPLAGKLCCQLRRGARPRAGGPQCSRQRQAGRPRPQLLAAARHSKSC